MNTRTELTMNQAFGILSKHLTKIGAYSLLTAFIVGLLSLFLPDYYTSKAIMYPASQDLAKPIFDNASEKAIQYYGTESDKDRLLSLLHSQKLKEYLIEKYKLYSHYDISLDKKGARTQLRKKLKKHQTIIKTEFGAVQMAFEDKNPEMAYNMTNSALVFVDSIGRTTYQNSNKGISINVKKSITELEHKLKSLTDSISGIKKRYNIVDIDRQGELILENIYEAQNKKVNYQAKLAVTTDTDSLKYYKQMTANIENQIKRLGQDEENLREGGSQLINIESEKERALETLNAKRELYNAYHSQIENDYPIFHLEESPQIADKKSRPRRSLYVLASFLLSFISLSLWTLIKDVK